jgi:CheY-like chemotaxis protein
VHLDRDPRVAAAEAGQDVGEHLGAEVRGRGEAQRAGGIFAQLQHRAHRLGQGAEPRAHAVEEGLPRRRRRHAARRPLEEPHAHCRLELLERQSGALARLADDLLDRSRVEWAEIARRRERLHVAVVRRAFVVDADLAAARALAELLTSSGHHAVVARDAPTSLRLAEAARPELAFLDLGLLGMGAYELARRLRALDAPRGMVLVSLTEQDRQAERERSRAAGFDPHLVKPVSSVTIRALLHDER